MADGCCPSCRRPQHCYSCARQNVMTPLSVDAEHCPRCGPGIEEEGMPVDFNDDEGDSTDDEDDDETDGSSDSGSDWDEEEIEMTLRAVTISAEDLRGSEGVHSTCTVCFGDFGEGEWVAQLPCQGGHRFHRECIWTWLMGSKACNKGCPNCRERVRR